MPAWGMPNLPPSAQIPCPARSGAVGVGCQRLKLCVRPDSLAQKQALAAVGQVHLMRYYSDLFGAVDLVSWLHLFVHPIRHAVVRC